MDRRLKRVSLFVALFALIGQIGGQGVVQAASEMSAAEKRKHRIRVNRELTWTMLENLISIGESEVAGSVLEEHLKVDPLDGRSWIFLSQVQLRQGKKEEAAKSLRRAKKIVGADEPRMVSYADAELRLASGDRKGAIVAFTSLAQGDGPIADKARRAVASIEGPAEVRRPSSLVGVPGFIEAKTVSKRELPAETSGDSAGVAAVIPWTGSANLSFLSGYDANILQIPDSVAPLAADIGSAFSTLGVQGVYSGGAWGGVVSFSGSAAYTRNLNDLAAGLNNFGLSGGMQWATLPKAGRRWQLSLGNQNSTSLMESAGYGFYALSTSLSPSIAYRLTDKTSAELSTSVGLNLFPGAEVDSSRDNRDGYQVGAGLGLRSTVGATSVAGNVGHTRQLAEGANFRTVGWNVSGTVSRPLGWLQSSLSSTVGYSMVDYPRSEGQQGTLLGYQSSVSGGAAGEHVPILVVRSDGILVGELWTTAGSLAVYSAVAVDDGNWHTVYFSGTPGSIKLFLDGVEIGSGTGTVLGLSMIYNQLGTGRSTGRTLMPYANPSSNQWYYFNGLIDDFTFYSTAL